MSHYSGLVVRVTSWYQEGAEFDPSQATKTKI